MLVLPNELTQSQATACLRMLVQGLRAQSGPDVVVDATALSRFDSAALAVLLEFRRETLAVGKRFSIRGLPARLGDLASLYGIDELLPATPLTPIK
ncbi:MAG: STAS domain-containing protein [Rhodoferax sp.]|uniref:STAS domain-containing protein n=1 Tax=Rhodoferax sp. TaxID=50421 RepID=UPI00271609A4|nr:STAS domain-containing protein [Rhodoferax sp.]MDO8451051.1 STAS domain-containing protein [Rhodoferax sp.]